MGPFPPPLPAAPARRLPIIVGGGQATKRGRSRQNRTRLRTPAINPEKMRPLVVSHSSQGVSFTVCYPRSSSSVRMPRRRTDSHGHPKGSLILNRPNSGRPRIATCGWRDCFTADGARAHGRLAPKERQDLLTLLHLHRIPAIRRRQSHGLPAVPGQSQGR